MTDFPLFIGKSHINFDLTCERQQEFLIGLHSLMQPKFQPVGNRVQEEIERKLDAGGWHPRGQGPSVMLFRRLFPWRRWLSSLSWRRRERRTFCCVLFTGRSRAADWSARCTRHRLIYRTHTHRQDTFAHGPLGVERGSPDALSRDLRGRETARLHRWNRGPRSQT